MGVSRAQVQAAHTAAVGSNADEDQEELVIDEEVPQEVEEQDAGGDDESIQINRNKYVAVDIYNNDYYARDDEEEHMFGVTTRLRSTPHIPGAPSPTPKLSPSFPASCPASSSAHFPAPMTLNPGDYRINPA
ncbi:hypothetical protein C0992_008315 [Termitomyces sp. T32_za158]|nr:hypothetical protein C0992_008315 [Termitomyces sp. T32_za158]